jgi:regulatory protein
MKPSDKSAFDTALNMLARHMRTEKEIRERLAGRGGAGGRARNNAFGGGRAGANASGGFGEAETDDAIERLKELGYIDDRAYAARYLELLMDKKRGRRRIKEDMRRRGLAAEVVEDVVEGAYTEKAERANAICVAERALAMLPEGMDPRKKAQKVSSRLVTQGYDYDMINAVIERLIFRRDS